MLQISDKFVRSFYQIHPAASFHETRRACGLVQLLQAQGGLDGCCARKLVAAFKNPQVKGYQCLRWY